MTSLNDIPEYLRSPEQDDDWTPNQGIAKGAVYTGLLGVGLGLAIFGLTKFIPSLTCYWLLQIAYAFVVAWLLFAVNQSASGMVSIQGTTIVVACAVLIVLVKHLAVLGLMAKEMNPKVSVWTLLDKNGFVFLNYPALVGIGLAVYLCKDGDSILSEVSDRLMSNPFTGRRS